MALMALRWFTVLASQQELSEAPKRGTAANLGRRGEAPAKGFFWLEPFGSCFKIQHFFINEGGMCLKKLVVFGGLFWFGLEKACLQGLSVSPKPQGFVFLKGFSIMEEPNKNEVVD